MDGESVTGSRKKSKNSSNSNCSTSINKFWAEERVFGIDWLREEILKYVIYDNSGSISRKSVKNARVVQKLWLQTITKLLRKLEEPLITLAADGNADDTTEKGKKRLDQLVERFGTCDRLPESFLPVKLNLTVEFFRRRNYQSLSDCLTHLGSSLMELQLEYPKSGATMPSIFSTFNLPNLWKLSFQFSNTKLKKESDDVDVFADNRNGLWLLQTILNASKNLQNFNIPFSYFADVVPLDFEYLRLPISISVLGLRVKLTNKDFESILLLRNHLPNLTHLTLMLYNVPFEDGILFRVLERFQKTLQAFQITGGMSTGHPRPHTLLQFPCMEKLKEIRISSTECELAPANTLSLEKCLPGLKIAAFNYTTEARLVKWIENSKFRNVEDVSVFLANVQLHYNHERHHVSPSFEVLTQLHQAFPNVKSMTISFNITDLSGLKYLFRHMASLQVLKIMIRGNGVVLDNSSDLIDSTLLGLPLWMVEGLKKDQKSSWDLESILKSSDEPSIRDLSELENLFLWTDSGLESGPVSLISDLLFQHSFRKMTKLWSLNLCGKFQPSLKMQQEWENQGRDLEYNPCCNDI